MNVFVDAVWPIVGYFERPVTGQPMQVIMRYDSEREVFERSLIDAALSNQAIRIAYLGAPDVWHRNSNVGVIVRAERMDGNVGESLVQPRSQQVGEDIATRFDECRKRETSQGAALLQALYDYCHADTKLMYPDDPDAKWRALVALGRPLRRLLDARNALFAKRTPMLVVVLVVKGSLAMPTPYDPGYRPRCGDCPVDNQELTPAESKPGTYSGFRACPRHPRAKIRYPLYELLASPNEKVPPIWEAE